MQLNHLLAYGLLASAQAAIGVNVIAGKLVLDSGMPLSLFLCVRFLFSSLVLTLLVLITKSAFASIIHPTGKFHAKDWGFLLAQAFTGGFLFNYLFYRGLGYTTATSAGIISSTLPAMIAICAFLFLREKLNKAQLIAVLLAGLGILVINLDNVQALNAPKGSFFGDFLVLVAMLPEALYCIFNKYIGPRFTPLGSAMIVNWFIFLMMLPLGVVSFMENPSLDYAYMTWIFVALGGLCSAYFFWAWPKGMLIIFASTAAIFAGVMPVVTSFLGWRFLHEHFGWFDAIGMILVLSSIVIGTHSNLIKKIAIKPPF